MNKQSRKKRSFKKPEINREKGLNISYDYKELFKFLPHLVEEIKGEKSAISIDSVDYEVEVKNLDEKQEKRDIDNVLKELENPTTLDFIRRCSTKEEAIEIINYLLEREEISKEKAVSYKNQLKKEGGLRALIEKGGGFKQPGYYMRRFYLQESKSEKKLERSNQN